MTSLALCLIASHLIFAQSRDPVALWFWGDRSPATTAGVPNNLVMKGSPYTATYRTYYRLREEGDLLLSVWFRNIIDSQSEHPLSAPANDSCSGFRIVAATVSDGGIAPDGSVVAGSSRQLTWNGSLSRIVTRGESLWSDTVRISLPPGHYLAYTWTVEKQTSDDAIPHPYQTQYSCFTKSGLYAFQESAAGFSATADYAVTPNAIAYKKPVTRIIGFLGNSITQGFNVSKDSYAFWVAQAAMNLGPNYGVWNLGSGWAQARDAATNRAWLGKVKCCDDAVISLGVNDIRNGTTSSQVLGYISTVISSLRQISPAKRIILCTIPPLNFTGTAETQWRAVNTAIRARTLQGVAAVFDIAALLGQSPPNDNLANPAYGDGHPNDNGGKAVGKAFAAFYTDTVLPQPPSPSLVITPIWSRTYPYSSPCIASSICQISGNAFLAIGSVHDSSGTSRALFLKTDSCGDIISQDTVRQAGFAAVDCKSTFERGYIVTGNSADSAGFQDMSVGKYDSAGNEIFHVFPAGGLHGRAYTVVQTADSGYCFAGYSAGSFGADTAIAVSKINKDGSFVFVHTFGDTGFNCGFSLVSAGNGGCVMTGGTQAFGENGGADIFLAKLDVSGSVQWNRIFGRSGDDVAYGLTRTFGDGYAVVGSTTSFGSGRKAFVLRVDSSGNYLWHKINGGSAGDGAYGVVQMPDSGFMVAMNMPSYSSDSAAAVIRTNAAGDSIGIVKFLGYIAQGGSPLRDAGNGRAIFCYTSLSGGAPSVGVALLRGN